MSIIPQIFQHANTLNIGQTCKFAYVWSFWLASFFSRSKRLILFMVLLKGGAQKVIYYVPRMDFASTNSRRSQKATKRVWNSSEFGAFFDTSTINVSDTFGQLKMLRVLFKVLLYRKKYRKGRNVFKRSIFLFPKRNLILVMCRSCHSVLCNIYCAVAYNIL